MTPKTYLKKAFSLVELLLVLGVIASLLIAGFIVYPQVRAKNQATTEASNILLIQANVRNIFASKGGNYMGLGNGRGASDPGISNQARVFPTTMNGGDYSKNANVTSTWGAPVTVWKRPLVTTSSGTIPANFSFGIVYDFVPSDVCVHLMPALSGNFVLLETTGATSGKKTQLLDEKGNIIPERVGEACADNPAFVLTSL